MMNECSDKAFFQDRYYLIAKQHLRRLQKRYHHQLHKLTNAIFHNLLSSIQWCHNNEQRQMVIDFALPLQDFFDQQNYWREGIRCITWALEAARFLNDEEVQSSLYFNLGLLYDRQGNLDEAESKYQTSAELASKMEQTVVLANAKHRLGWIAHSRRNHDQAEFLYLEAKALRENLPPPDPLALSRSWHQLGILSHEKNDYLQAQSYYEKGLALRRAYNDRYLIAASLHQLGALAIEQQSWKQAKNYFEETLSIRRELKDRVGEAYVLDQMGVIAQRQEQWQVARKHYLDSLELKEELGDGAGLIRAKIHLGEVCLAQKQIDEAIGWFKSCLEDSKILKNAYFEGQSHLKLGYIFYINKNYEVATTHYQQSLQIFSGLDGLKREQAGIFYQLGLIAHNQGQLHKAHQEYHTGLIIQEEEGLMFEAAMTHLQLGMIYQAWDIYDAAQQHYQVSYDTFEKEGVLSYQAEAVYRLGNIAELLRQPDQAYNCYLQAEKLCNLHNLTPLMGLKEALNRVKYEA